MERMKEGRFDKAEGRQGGSLSVWAALFVRKFSVHKVVRSLELELVIVEQQQDRCWKWWKRYR